MQRLSELDAAILAAETPTQHLHVLATLVLSAENVQGEYYPLFQQRVRERFHLIEPLRRRLRGLGLSAPTWVDDAAIHLESHLHHVVVDQGGLLALARQASEIASHPLPRDRPLWEAWMVEGMAPDQIGVIAKVHHCAVDGVSGIGALAAFFDLEPFPTQPTAWPEWDPAAPPGAMELAREAMKDLRTRPLAAARSLRRVAATSLAFARAAGSAPLPLTGPRLSFNRALTSRRSVAFASLALDEIKDLRRAFDVTINDVLNGLMTGVLRTYLERAGELPDRPIVAAVPTSERKPEHGLSGNRLSMMLYSLPVHVADPGERLLAVQRSAAAAKDLYARSGVGLFADLAALAPFGVMGLPMRMVSRLRLANAMPPIVNVIVSNIRGPGFPLYVAGARLERMYPMGPLIEGVGLGLTAVSYRDEVTFGFIACPDLVPDVQELAHEVPSELARLRQAAAAS